MDPNRNVSATLLLLLLPIAASLTACDREERKSEALRPQLVDEPAPVSEEMRRQAEALETYNANLRNLDEKIQEARDRIERMGSSRNWNLKNRLTIIESMRKKTIEDALRIEKRAGPRFADRLSRINTSLELLARDVDRLQRKMNARAGADWGPKEP
jgi:hypothetical protein